MKPRNAELMIDAIDKNNTLFAPANMSEKGILLSCAKSIVLRRLVLGFRDNRNHLAV